MKKGTKIPIIRDGEMAYNKTLDAVLKALTLKSIKDKESLFASLIENPDGEPFTGFFKIMEKVFKIDLSSKQSQQEFLEKERRNFIKARDSNELNVPEGIVFVCDDL